MSIEDQDRRQRKWEEQQRRNREWEERQRKERERKERERRQTASGGSLVFGMIRQLFSRQPKKKSKEKIIQKPLLKSVDNPQPEFDSRVQWPFSNDKWVKKSQRLVDFDPNNKNSVDRIAFNKRITKAYEDIYRENTKIFKWAGLAGYASSTVGKSMYDLKESDVKIWIFNALPGKEIHRSALYRSLADGNLLIYSDMMRQHLAYKEGGIKTIKKLYTDGKITDQLFQAWEDIDNGAKTNNVDLIWKGNIGLAHYEQNDLLQKLVLDKERDAWKEFSSSFILAQIKPIVSSTPGIGKKSFQDFLKESMPEITNPDFSDQKQRWKWMSENIIPAWRKYEE